jgi:hypothetical protein
VQEGAHIFHSSCPNRPTCPACPIRPKRPTCPTAL